jgi:murein DD-endopeptidase MepM/ murein hydrolase activator NlpD
MRITRVIFAFFAIGFLAGSFERAAGLGDPERPKRMTDRYVDAAVARSTKLVLASVGPIGSNLPEVVLASIQTTTDPTLEAVGAAWSEFVAQPTVKADGLPSLSATPPLNPDLQRRRLVGKKMLSEPDAGVMSKLPAVASLGRTDEKAPRGRSEDPGERARANDGFSQEFIMPFERGRVTSLFHQGRYHPAIDLAGSLGSTVHSTTRKQRVTFAGWRGGYGNAVITRDEFGRTHLYGHLLRIFAGVGNILDQGQKLGALGSTGHSTGPHVHYEVRGKSGAHINPVTLLFPGRPIGRGFAWNGSRSIRPNSGMVAQAQPRPR